MTARSLLATLVLVACQTPDDGELASVRKGDLVIGVEVTGALEAVDSTPIRPPGLPNVWNFKISFLTAEGTVVKKGDRLAGFDTSELMQDLETMKNESESAASEIRRQASAARMTRENETLALAEREAAVGKLELKVDVPSDLFSLVELKTAKLDAQIAGLQLEHARARQKLATRSDAATLAGYRDKLEYANGRIAQIQANLARMTVVAERPGTVIHPSSGRGDKAKVGDSVWRMRTVLEVVSLDAMRGSGTVDEVDSSRLELGRPFTLRVDAHPDTELSGTIEEIADGFTPKSRADPSKVVKVKLAISDSMGLPLRPGMRFRGEIEVGRVVDTLSVPASAVFVGPNGPIVYRRAGDRFETVAVKVGARSAKEIEILEGLSADDRVATSLPEAM